MTTLIWVVVALVLAGSVLAMAESSLSRMTRVRALALESEGRRNAALLVKLETDPPRYLNAVYLAVMFVQNGSAILVAILAEEYFGNLGVTLASVGFTIAYFFWSTVYQSSPTMPPVSPESGFQDQYVNDIPLVVM